MAVRKLIAALLFCFLPSQINCGQLCVSCSETEDTKNCITFARCDDDEVCFLHKYVTEQGVTKYDAGCTYPEYCGSSAPGDLIIGKRIPQHSHILCQTCCNDTYLCNRDVSCLNQGISQEQSCLSCTGIDDPSKCRTKAVCQPNEKCFLHKYRTESQKELYDLGCKLSTLCVPSYTHAFGRRRSSEGHRILCESCCDDGNDCNSHLQCTHHHTSDLCGGTKQCLNGGTCNNGVCVCADGYLGQSCQNSNTSQTTGVTKPCLNGGTFENGVCVCFDGSFGQKCQYSDGNGNEFLVLFPVTNKYWYGPGLLIAAKENTNVSIRYLQSRWADNITSSKNSSQLHLSSWKLVRKQGSDFTTALHVTSDKAIRVYGFNFHTSICEGFLVIPTKFLSTHYLISALIYQSLNSFGIVSLYDNTIVTVHFRLKQGFSFYNSSIIPNQTLTIKLQKFDSFQLVNDYDLTGTEITSSKSVAVVSGTECALINHVTNNCQPFMEMVLPTNQLDNFYIIPTLKHNNQSSVRVLAITNTKVTHNMNGTGLISLKSREYVDLIHQNLSYVNASNDVMVMMYPNEVKDKGDASMMTVPGVNQYLYDYEFVVPNYSFENYISVTVSSDAVNGFALDGREVRTPTTVDISYSNIQYSSFVLPISSGYHRLTHNKKARFGLWVYGYQNLDAYGFPAGIAFKTV